MKYQMGFGLSAVALAVMMSSGCILFQTGSATTEGSVGGREVSLSGTVFSWWDETVYDVDDDGNLFKQTRDGEEQHLNIALYGFSFNPREDQRFWSWQQIVEFNYNMMHHDHLSFTVGAAGGLSNGARLEYNNEDPPIPDDNPHLLGEPGFYQAPVKVNETNDYPGTVKEPGSRRVYVLELSTVEREPGSEIKGSFEVKIEKAENDPSNVVTGSVRGDFTAPLIHERIAECNFSGGGAGMGVDPCADLELDGETP